MAKKEEELHDFLDSLGPRGLNAALLGLLVVSLVFVLGYNIVADADSKAGTFGDFVGGTLNPILGFLSVVVLGATLAAQRIQLQEARAERRQNELLSLLASISDKLDPLIAVEPQREASTSDNRRLKTFGDFFEEFVENVAANSAAVDVRTSAKLLAGKVGRQRVGRDIAQMLLVLADVAREYLAHGGSDAVIRTYSSLYMHEVLAVPECFEFIGTKQEARLRLSPLWERVENVEDWELSMRPHRVYWTMIHPTTEKEDPLRRTALSEEELYGDPDVPSSGGAGAL